MLTVGFLLVHALVVYGVLGPTHAVRWLRLQPQHQHPLLLLLLPLLLRRRPLFPFLERLHSLSAIHHNNNIEVMLRGTVGGAVVGWCAGGGGVDGYGGMDV